MGVKVSIIVAAYNEAEFILETLNRVNKSNVEGFVFEIIVIDDGSLDNTVHLLKENRHLYTHLIEREENGGKGADKPTGEYILFQDADLEYDPSDYESLLEPVRLFKADIVLGSRLAGSSITRVSYFWHKVGNKLITFIFNILNNTTFTDIYSCYLLYRRDLVDPARIGSKGWAQHAEIISQAIRQAKTIFEVPVSYFGRSYEEGKKIRGYHAISVVWMIFKKRFLG